MKITTTKTITENDIKAIIAAYLKMKPEDIKFTVSPKYDFRGDDCGYSISLVLTSIEDI
jgi:hypothetical protein